MAGRPVHTFQVVHREQLTDHLVETGAGRIR